jgi:serine/threonine-protein kinase
LVFVGVGLAVLVANSGGSSRTAAVPSSAPSSNGAPVAPKETAAVASSQTPTIAVTDLPQSPAPPSKGTQKGTSLPRTVAPVPAATSVTPATPAQSAPVAPVKDCNPPYEVNDKGIRHYKPECLQ